VKRGLSIPKGLRRGTRLGLTDCRKLTARVLTVLSLMSRVSLSARSSSSFTPPLAAQERIHQQPEYRLLWAVLQEAIETYMKYASASGRRGQRLFREAEEWIMLDDDLWLYSFTNVCHILGLDPDYIRTGLRRWHSRAQASGIQTANNSLQSL
jgi:hypothetical protein